MVPGGTSKPLEQSGGEIAFSEARNDGDDDLAGHLRTRGHIEGGSEGGAGGYAHRDTLLARGAFGHREAVLVGNLDDLVDHSPVEDRRHETRADALDLVRSGLASRQHGRGG